MARATWSGSISFWLVNVPVKLYPAVRKMDVHFHQLDEKSGAPKAYALLRDAMDRTDRVAIGRFVMRTKEHLVMLRPVDNTLVLHTMLYPDEIVASSDVDGLPVRVKTDARELKMASQLVESLTVEWDPKRYKDTHRERLLDVIKRKAKGEEIVTEPVHEQAAEVVDLMAALEASIEGSKKRGRRAGSKSRSRSRKSA